MKRYPLIATIFMLAVTIHSAWTGSAPDLGFWGHLWYFIFGTLFVSAGLIGGELFRRFVHPDVLVAQNASELFKQRVFWKAGPQLIGAVVGLIAHSGFMHNVLGYNVG